MINVLAMLHLMLPGTAITYYGEEIGMHDLDDDQVSRTAGRMHVFCMFSYIRLWRLSFTASPTTGSIQRFVMVCNNCVICLLLCRLQVLTSTGHPCSGHQVTCMDSLRAIQHGNQWPKTQTTLMLWYVTSLAITLFGQWMLILGAILFDSCCSLDFSYTFDFIHCDK